MRQLPSLISLSLFIVLFAFFALKNNHKTQSELIENGRAFCGTIDPAGKFSNCDDFYESKQLFNHNCGYCHAANMKSKATGPPLLPAIKYWESDSLGSLIYFNNSSSYFEKIENSRLDSVRHDYGFINSHSNDLSIVDVKMLVFYIKSFE